MLYFNRIINSVALFSGLCRACLAALSPKPMETSPEHRTGLSIWQPLKLLLWTLHKETKIEGLKYSFLTQEKLLQQ